MTEKIPPTEPGEDERELELIALEKAALLHANEHGHDDGRGGEDE